MDFLGEGPIFKNFENNSKFKVLKTLYFSNIQKRFLGEGPNFRELLKSFKN